MAATTDRQPILPTTSAGQRRTTKGNQTPPPTKPSGAEACGSACIFVLVVLGAVYLCRLVWLSIAAAFEPVPPVEYTVTIAAVSGLDPERHLQLRLAPLDPAFNLTLRVAAPTGAGSPGCIKAGTAVEVSYLRSRVPLASGPAPEFCVAPGEEREEGSVVAWGNGVRLPGFVLDSLAADMSRGTAEFGVKFTAPLPYCGSSYCSGFVKVVSCWAKIGAPATCSVSDERASFPVPHPGRGDSAYLGQQTQ
ncbi:hypothetical protein ACP70R_009289 [Stipagrostis hirtigluma subsp. patula]